jgi:hypothetical protein
VLLSALAASGLIAGCEQPLPPANPTPIEIAAEQLNVPASTLHQLQTTASQLQAPGGSGAPVGPSSPEAERLRRAMASLQEAYQRQTPGTP